MKTNLNAFSQRKLLAGFSLTELLVAASLSSMVLSAGGFGLVAMANSNVISEAKTERRIELNRAIDYISEDIRQARKVEAQGNDLKITLPNNDTIIYAFQDISDGDTVWVQPGAITRQVNDGEQLTLVDGLINVNPATMPSCSGTGGGNAGFQFCLQNTRLVQINLYGYLKDAFGRALDPLEVNNLTLARNLEISNPSSSSLTETPETSETPETPNNPEISDNPETPETSDNPETSETTGTNDNHDYTPDNTPETTNETITSTLISTPGNTTGHTPENSTVSFSVSSGTLTLNQPATLRFEVLGGALQCGATKPNIPVTTQLIINGQLLNQTLTSGQSLEMPPGSVSTVVVKSNASTGDDSNNYGCEHNFTSDSLNTSQVYVLRNGDSVPNIAPLYNQNTIDAYLKNYLQDGKVTIADNQVIYLFELGTTNRDSSAYDLQDNVVLVTIDPS